MAGEKELGDFFYDLMLQTAPGRQRHFRVNDTFALTLSLLLGECILPEECSLRPVSLLRGEGAQCQERGAGFLR